MHLQLGEAPALTDDEARRIEALFTWISSTGSAYPAFCRAARSDFRATWWVDTVDAIARRDRARILASAATDGEAEPLFSPREVLEASAQLCAHYKALIG